MTKEKSEEIGDEMEKYGGGEKVVETKIIEKIKT